MPPTIGALTIYPIKSCRGLSLQSAMLTEAGLKYDREWMIVRADSGKFISQREKELLALVDVSLPPEALSTTHLGAVQLPPDAAMVVSAPGMDPLQVPLVRRPDSALRQVTVWEWTGAGSDEGEDAAAWFSRYLGLPARLVRYLGTTATATPSGTATSGGQPPAAASGGSGSGDGGGAGALASMRTTEPEFAVGYETRFSDGYPMLMATQAALADLNSKLTDPVPMNRFRPNIEVAGSDPWAEDGWRDMDVVSSADGRTLRLTSVKPCSRCKVPTINQATAVAGDEPLDTLQAIRSGAHLGWNKGCKSWTHAVFFGWNVVSRTTGVISVGDVLTPVTRQQPTELPPAP